MALHTRPASNREVTADPELAPLLLSADSALSAGNKKSGTQAINAIFECLDERAAVRNLALTFMLPSRHQTF